MVSHGFKARSGHDLDFFAFQWNSKGQTPRKASSMPRYDLAVPSSHRGFVTVFLFLRLMKSPGARL